MTEQGNMYSILIVEDNHLIAEAWSIILESEGHKICAIASTTKEALEEAKKYRPQVVLMDISLKDGDSFDVTHDIVNTLPNVKVIALSSFDEISIAKKMLSKGASAYLTKNSSKSELLDAIQAVMNGEQFIDNLMKNKFISSMFDKGESEPNLTNREIEVVKMISKGFTSKEIGEHFGISSRTVDTHRYNILKKLNLPNSAQLGIWAKDKGLV
tara:strand:- start:96119 stop:96757 length:639 start_codon:yes stop_codon:yes gene_type:complete